MGEKIKNKNGAEICKEEKRPFLFLKSFGFTLVILFLAGIFCVMALLYRLKQEQYVQMEGVKNVLEETMAGIDSSVDEADE